MFEKIISEENLYSAYKKTLLGQSKYKSPAVEFALHETYNLNKLRLEIKEQRYRTLDYTEFRVYEPKERDINAPQYRDKIVQHMVNNIIAPYFKARFIKDSYACITGKGNQRAVYQIQRYMRLSKWQYGEGSYIVKVDISKFFRSIDRDTLKAILARYIPCKLTLELLYIIIDRAPEDNGLPLGNLTSQTLANVYMNELDQYIKRVLRVKYYVRYADDLFLIVENKQVARELYEKIDTFVSERLKMVVHPLKSGVQPTYTGLNALGFKIYTTHIVLRYDSKVRIKRRIRNIPKLVNKGFSVDRLEQGLNSWLNFAKTAQAYFFIQSLVDKYPYLYLDKKQLFRIDVRMLVRVGLVEYSTVAERLRQERWR